MNAIILPLLFLSGIFIPFGDDTPEWIRTVGQGLPREALRRRHAGRVLRRAGFEFLWRDVLVVAIWGLAGLILAARFFTGNRKSEV